jgi:hypothetical protein
MEPHTVLDEPELTTAEIAQRLRMVPDTIRRFYKEGMPGRKISYNKHLFQLSAVNAWLEKREAQKQEERAQRRKEQAAQKILLKRPRANRNADKV